MPEKLGHAALLMMDMDNLKQINDTFGHDWGDRYINLAGQCFAQTLPQNTICARMSGDEFIVLFYGYDRRDEIRQVLNRLSEAIKGAHGASAERRHHAHQHFRRYRVVSGERQGSGYA